MLVGFIVAIALIHKLDEKLNSLYPEAYLNSGLSNRWQTASELNKLFVFFLFGGYKGYGLDLDTRRLCLFYRVYIVFLPITIITLISWSSA